MARGGDQTHFGYENVPLADKQGRVDDVFRSVARRYDLMNDLMSGGLHRAWKDTLVTAVNPPKSAREFAVLDLAGGLHIRRSLVMGAHRVELAGFSDGAVGQVKALGLTSEIIAWRLRLFVLATKDRGPPILAALQQLILAAGDRIESVDLNPVIVTKDSDLMAVDALIVRRASQ